MGVDKTAITVEAPENAVVEWFARLGEYCAAIDYDAAAPLIDDAVVSFGTKAELAQGFETYRSNQWEYIWPNIENFAFDMDGVHADGQGGLAWGAATWTSTGFDKEGNPYERPGRATVILVREDRDWRAVHTHFSLHPGTPQVTHGPGGKES